MPRVETMVIILISDFQKYMIECFAGRSISFRQNTKNTSIAKVKEGTFLRIYENVTNAGYDPKAVMYWSYVYP